MAQPQAWQRLSFSDAPIPTKMVHSRSGLLRCTYRMHHVRHMHGGAGDVTWLSIVD